MSATVLVLPITQDEDTNNQLMPIMPTLTKLNTTLDNRSDESIEVALEMRFCSMLPILKVGTVAVPKSAS